MTKYGVFVFRIALNSVLPYNKKMELATLHLDTYKVVKLLQEKGYSEKEAEGFIQAIQEITLSGVATKQDVHDVRGEIQALRNDFHELESKISKGFSDNLKFQLIQTLTLIGVMVALLQFFSVPS